MIVILCAWAKNMQAFSRAELITQRLGRVPKVKKIKRPFIYLYFMENFNSTLEMESVCFIPQFLCAIYYGKALYGPRKRPSMGFISAPHNPTAKHWHASTRTQKIPIAPEYRVWADCEKYTIKLNRLMPNLTYFMDMCAAFALGPPPRRRTLRAGFVETCHIVRNVLSQEWANV